MYKHAHLLVGPLIGLTIFAAYWTLTHKSSAADSVPVALNLPPAAIIGSHADFRGEATAPYTLVEFADYQCPPCKAANAQVAGVLDRYKGRLRFTFRNYPLAFHPQALPAALAAEAARRQGKFWPMHDALYHDQADLSTAHIAALVTTLGLDKARFAQDRNAAQQAIAGDKKTADSFHLTGTPTFVLCGPDKRVVRLASLNQVAEFVK